MIILPVNIFVPLNITWPAPEIVTGLDPLIGLLNCKNPAVAFNVDGAVAWIFPFQVCPERFDPKRVPPDNTKAFDNTDPSVHKVAPVLIVIALAPKPCLVPLEDPRKVVLPFNVVDPVYVLIPVSVNVPTLFDDPIISEPFVPLMTPAKVSFGLEIVSVLLPNTTDPVFVPDKLTIDVPDVAPLIFRIALVTTRLELEMEPVPTIANIPPLMVVKPVKVFAPDSVMTFEVGWISEPVPEITPDKVTFVLPLKVIKPLLTMLLVIDPTASVS